MAEQSQSLVLTPGPEAPAKPAGGRPTPAQVKDRYSQGSRAIRSERQQYQINSSYLAGNQWVFVNKVTNNIAELPRNNDRARVTIPRLGGESRAIIAKVTQRPLLFQVPPDAADDAHVRGARIAEGVLTDTARTHDWERHRLLLTVNAWKGGTGLLCLDWDASSGKEISALDEVTMRPLNVGDLVTTTLSISEVATEPGTRDIRFANWWIKARALPPEEVQTMYDLKEEPAPDATPAEQARTSGQVRATEHTPLTSVLTYYERPNKKNQRGCIGTVVGGAWVDGPHDWYFPFTERLNVSPALETVVESRWTGNTILSDAIPIQTALNASWSSIVEHVKQAGNARLMIEEGSQDLAQNYTDEAGEFQLYRDKEPAWLTPPVMPNWWIEMPDKLAAEMDDALGRHDVSRGQAPANIESGLGIQILVEQDETPTGHLTRVIADAFGDFATMVLRLYESKATETRTASVTLPGQPAQQVEWTGESFLGQTYARVPYEAVAPMNEAARFSRAMLLVQAGLLQGPEAFSNFMAIGGNERPYDEEINPHIAKARRENYAMARGEIVIPTDFDDNAIHINIHNNFRTTSEYEQLPPQDKDMVDMHVQAHSTLAAEEMGAQVAKGQQYPELAMAAQATQPPGSTIPGMDGGQSEANNAPRPPGVVNPMTGPEANAAGAPPGEMPEIPTA